MPALKRETISLARFLLAGAGDRSSLNDGPARTPRAALGERLLVTAVAAWRRHENAARAALEETAAELIAYDLAALTARAERLAFWLNVYNALALHATLRFGIRDSIREAPGFFNRAAYRISGVRFSLNEIEHGILRGNRAPLPGLPPPFSPGDSRDALAVRPLDPRIHFALHCATRSCPLPRPYKAETLDADLDATVTAFLLGGGVEVSGGNVYLSALFDLYRDDFGGEEGVAAFVLRYLPPDAERHAIMAALRARKITYPPYDWTLPSR